MSENKEVTVKVRFQTANELKQPLAEAATAAARATQHVNRLATAWEAAKKSGAGASRAIIAGMSQPQTSGMAARMAGGNPHGALAAIWAAAHRQTSAPHWLTAALTAPAQYGSLSAISAANARQGSGAVSPMMATLGAFAKASNNPFLKLSTLTAQSNATQLSMLSRLKAGFGDLGEKIEGFGAISRRAMLYSTGSMMGFAAAASPALFNTLTMSMQAFAGELGIVLTPAIMDVTELIRIGANWIRSWPPAVRSTVSSIAFWTVTLGGAGYAMGKIWSIGVSMVGMFGSIAGGAATAGRAILAFAVAHPILAVAAAVGAVAGAFILTGNNIRNATTDLNSFEERVNRLRGGGRATLQDIREMPAVQARLEGQPEARRQQIIQEEIAARERQLREANAALAPGQTFEGIAARVQQTLERTDRQENVAGWMRIGWPSERRANALREAGVPEPFLDQLNRDNRLRAGFMGSGHLSDEHIREAADAIRTIPARLQSEIATLRGGPPQGGEDRFARLRAIMPSLNFQSQQIAPESFWNYVQQQAVRDPAEQDRFERQMIALNTMIASLGGGEQGVSRLLQQIRDMLGQPRP